MKNVGDDVKEQSVFHRGWVSERLERAIKAIATDVDGVEALFRGDEQKLQILPRRQHLANPQPRSPLLAIYIDRRFSHIYSLTKLVGTSANQSSRPQN